MLARLCVPVPPTGRHRSYKSPVIRSSDTAIYIDANDLNILQVTFDASNVFNLVKSQVDYLLIDFYFVNQADGALVRDLQKKLDSKNGSYLLQQDEAAVR